jgi:hypothetical protein
MTWEIALILVAGCLAGMLIGVTSTLITAVLVADIVQRARTNNVSPLTAYVPKTKRANPPPFDPLGSNHFETGPDLNPEFERAARRAAEAVFGPQDGILEK